MTIISHWALLVLLGAGCAGQVCANEPLSDEMLQWARKTQLKAQIMRQLGVTPGREPVGVGARERAMAIPRELKAQLMEANRWMYQVEEEQQTQDGQVLMFARRDPSHGVRCGGSGAKSPTACLTFDLTELAAGSRVESAELWIYKLRDPRDGVTQVFVVDELLPLEYQLRVKVQDSHLSSTDIKSGWVRVDVTSVVRRWLGKSYQHRELKVTCKTCAMSSLNAPIALTDNQHRPLIVVNTQKTIFRSRTRRSLNSQPQDSQCHDSPNGHCCLKRLKISFHEIGLDWIIMPTEFWGNYCNGTCSTPGITTERYRITGMLQSRAMLEEDEELKKAMTPCCSPLRLQDMSIIYQNDSTGNELVSHMLRDMSILECGCA